MKKSSIPTPLTVALDSSPVGMATLEGERGYIAYSNPAFNGIFGYSSAPAISLADLDDKSLTELHAEAIHSNECRTLPYHGIRGRWFSISATPLSMHDQTSFITMTDITESIHQCQSTAQEYMEKLQLYENTLDNLNYSVSILSYPEMIVQFANKAICDYISQIENRTVTKSDLLGKSFRQFTSDGTTHNPMFIAREAGRSKSKKDIEPACYVSEDGTRRYARVSYIPLQQDGIVTHVVNAGVDITPVLSSQQILEDRISRQHEFLGRLLDSIDTAMFVVQYPSLAFVYSNKQSRKIINASREPALEEDDLQKTNLLETSGPNSKAVQAARKAGALNEAVDVGVISTIVEGREHHYKTTFIPMETDEAITHIAGIVIDVSDLLEASMEVENLSKAKDDLLALVSHELRTPLTVMMGYLQLMKLHIHDTDEDKRLESFDKILTHGKRMDRIIADLLDYSRLGERSLDIDLTPVRLHELMDYLVESYRVGCTTHEIVFENPIPSVVLGDQLRLGQVFMNLFSNATRYSDESTCITVSMNIYSDKVRVSVRDEGWGIPDEAIPKLFERYYRTDQYSIKVPGMGIGLYVASEIIKSHGGALSVVSTLGKGSTFTVELPLTYGS